MDVDKADIWKVPLSGMNQRTDALANKDQVHCLAKWEICLLSSKCNWNQHSVLIDSRPIPNAIYWWIVDKLLIEVANFDFEERIDHLGGMLIQTANVVVPLEFVVL